LLILLKTLIMTGYFLITQPFFCYLPSLFMVPGKKSVQ
jgi:hypothetical protein